MPQNRKANEGCENCYGNKTEYPGGFNRVGPFVFEFVWLMIILHCSIALHQSECLTMLWVTSGGVVKLW